MLGFNGGLIGKDRNPDGNVSIPGLWYLNEQLKAKRSNLWTVGTVVGGDPYFSNVSLLMHGDGTNGSTTFVDSSSNNFAITPYGNAQISTTQSKFGGASMYFDGNGDYLTSAAVSDFEFGSGDFTVECWIYFNTITGPIVGLGDGASGNGTSRTGWNMLMSNSTQIAFYRYDGVETRYTFPFSPALSTWYHVAVSRSATSLRCFVNGSQVGSTVTTSVSYNKVNDQALHVGRFVSGSADSVVTFLNGYIDDLRITKGVARYTANFTPPTEPFPDL